MAHTDLNELLSALLPMAEMPLTKQGEFYPNGAIMGSVQESGKRLDWRGF
jgi:hypothetical protein